MKSSFFHIALSSSKRLMQLPGPIDERQIVVMDPMLATGGSAADAISMIKKHGGKKIKFMSMFLRIFALLIIMLLTPVYSIGEEVKKLVNHLINTYICSKRTLCQFTYLGVMLNNLIELN